MLMNNWERYGRSYLDRDTEMDGTRYLIQDILRGTAPTRAQIVGNMTVVPLVSDIVDNAIVPPDVLELETRGYGTDVAYNTRTDGNAGLTISP